MGQALRKVPEVNASWFPEYIRQYDYVDISVAVQTPAGLMVPFIPDADVLGLSDISTAVKQLASRVPSPPLSPPSLPPLSLRFPSPPLILFRDSLFTM